MSQPVTELLLRSIEVVNSLGVRQTQDYTKYVTLNNCVSARSSVRSQYPALTSLRDSHPWLQGTVRKALESNSITLVVYSE